MNIFCDGMRYAAGKTYLRSVGALLDCPVKERERLLGRLKGAVDAYLADSPDACRRELTENFGAPEVCAARLLEECDPTAVAAVRRKRNRRSRILIATLMVLLVLALSAAAYLWSTGGLVTIEITQYESEEAYREDEPWGRTVYLYDD